METSKEVAQSRRKKIWIDLDNSPHVPFFAPIIKELEKFGCQIVLTARDSFQTCELADLFGLEYRRIGSHYGKNKVLKVLGTLIRAMKLLPIACKEKPSISVSHGSRGLFIGSAILGIPTILITDYEFAEIVPFVHPATIMVPEVIPKHAFGKKHKYVVTYPGIKEDVYVNGFKPDQQVLKQLGMKNEDLVVTIRPPATEAHYHNPESENLFAEVIKVLAVDPDVRMVILPRNEVKQTDFIKRNWADLCAARKIIIPEHVVNGLDLIWFSDLVVSGGGTMNREAAALGVPVYSIFRGKIGAVDHYLSNEGRLTLLESVEDVRTKMKVARRDKSTEGPRANRGALEAIVENITSTLESL